MYLWEQSVILCECRMCCGCWWAVMAGQDATHVPQATRDLTPDASESAQHFCTTNTSNSRAPELQLPVCPQAVHHPGLGHLDDTSWETLLHTADVWSRSAPTSLPEPGLRGQQPAMWHSSHGNGRTWAGARPQGLGIGALSLLLTCRQPEPAHGQVQSEGPGNSLVHNEAVGAVQTQSGEGPFMVWIWPYCFIILWFCS